MTNLFYKRKTINGDIELKGIGKSVRLVLAEAEKHGITWENLPFTDTFKLQYLDNTKFFHGQIPSETTEYAHYCCANKDVSNNLLGAAGLAISKGHLLKHSDTLKDRALLFRNLQKPLVIKPANSLRGKSVHVNVTSIYKYNKAIKEIYANHSQRKVNILVEQMFMGHEYRILATQEKILSVIKRIAANVVGDGTSTIKELIATKNLDPIRNEIATYHSIEVDNKVLGFLKKQGFTLSSIPKKGTRIFLRPQGPLDISLGGDTIDVTDEIHTSVRKIVKKIMKNMPGLSLTGIDYITEDIHAPQTADNYRIIEVNASPSLDWNEFPLEGPQRRVAYEFLKIMFPSLN
jgi:cyanophycin synthetase